MTTLDLDKAVQKLEENIPAHAVAQRSGGGSKKLDYLETWYVIDRLNQVFGNLNWSSETVTVTGIPEADKPTYVARVRIMVNLPEGRVIFKDGMGWGCDKSGLNPHEMAVKEAESDALKRAAMKFGKSMGLALYDKSKEYVDEEPQTSPSTTGAKRAARKPVAVSASAETVEPKQPVATTPTTPQTQAEAVQLIASLVRVAEAKKKLTREQFQEHYQPKYKKTSIKELTLNEAVELVTYLRELCK